MKRVSTTILLALCFATVLAQAQMSMPKPAPELMKLDYLAGTWSLEADLKPGPMGPGGKATGTAHYEWMDGNFFLMSRGSFASAMGNGTEVTYMGYDSDQKMYTYTAFNSVGEHETSLGTVDGDNWTWLSDEDMGGHKVKGRFTMKVLSPTAYTYRFEISPDGTNWSTVMDGKASKTKSSKTK